MIGYKNLSDDDEFEIMFGGYTKTNSINMKQFLDILKYLKLFADENKFKILHTETLDISYNYDSKNFGRHLTNCTKKMEKTGCRCDRKMHVTNTSVIDSSVFGGQT